MPDNFSYKEAETENVNCYSCGGSKFYTLSRKGTDKMSLRAVMCKECGLIFINPRMTSEWYSRYYQEEYREKTIERGIEGSQFDPDLLFRETIGHGIFLGKLLSPYLKNNGKIVDVGSSVGGVLHGIREITGRDIQGIEPSQKEADCALRNGIPTEVTLIEDYSGLEKDPVSAIVCTQSMNHFLNPGYFLEWSHKTLQDDGILLIEVMNFRQQLRMAGKYENAVKIDHVYMYTPSVLRTFVESSGFKILYLEVDEWKKRKKDRHPSVPFVHIRLIARKTDRKPLARSRWIAIRPVIQLVTLSPILTYIIYIIKYRMWQKIKSIIQ